MRCARFGSAKAGFRSSSWAASASSSTLSSSRALRRRAPSLSTPFLSLVLGGSHAAACVVGVQAFVRGRARKGRRITRLDAPRCVLLPLPSSSVPAAHVGIVHRSQDICFLFGASGGYHPHCRREGGDRPPGCVSEYTRISLRGSNTSVPGSALIQACEAAGATIPRCVVLAVVCGLSDVDVGPRFCYHDRLAIAGNCR